MSVEAITWALKQRLGSPSGKAILFCLANYANERGECWPGHNTIAQQAEVSRRTVVEWMKRLEEIGALSRSRRFRPDGSRTSDSVVLDLSWQSPTMDSGPSAKSAHGQPGAASSPPCEDGDVHQVQPVHTMNRKRNHHGNDSPPNPPHGGLSEKFDLFWNAWPQQYRDAADRESMWGKFIIIAKEDDRILQITADDVSAYISAMVAKRFNQKKRGPSIGIRNFLRAGQWRNWRNAPKTDKDGDYIITPEREEWGAWLGYLRNTYGAGAVESAVKRGEIKHAHRWPPQQAREAAE